MAQNQKTNNKEHLVFKTCFNDAFKEAALIGFLVTLLSSCISGSIEGEWKLSEMRCTNTLFPDTTFQCMENFDINSYWIFDDDSVHFFHYPYFRERISYKYVLNSDTLFFYWGDSIAEFFTYKISGDSLKIRSLNQNSSVSYYGFVRENIEADKVEYLKKNIVNWKMFDGDWNIIACDTSSSRGEFSSFSGIVPKRLQFNNSNQYNVQTCYDTLKIIMGKKETCFLFENLNDTLLYLRIYRPSSKSYNYVYYGCSDCVRKNSVK